MTVEPPRVLISRTHSPSRAIATIAPLLRSVQDSLSNLGVSIISALLLFSTCGGTLAQTPLVPETRIEVEPTDRWLLHSTTEPGVHYTLQSTGTLSGSTTWSSATTPLQGLGSDVSIILVDPSSPSAPSAATFYYLEPLGAHGSAVSWSSGGNVYRQVIPEVVTGLAASGHLTTANQEMFWKKGSELQADPGTLNSTLPQAESDKLDEFRSSLPTMLAQPPNAPVTVKLDAPLESPPGERQFWRLTLSTPDTDGDGISDYDEFTGGLFTNPFSEDTDGDNLSDSDEIADGTNPAGNDSNENGIPDNNEVTLESETASTSLVKHGFDSFVPTTPPKKFLFQTVEWNPNYIGTVQPFDPDITELGNRITIINRFTGGAFPFTSKWGTLDYYAATVTGTPTENSRTTAMPWSAPGWDPILGAPGTLVGAATASEVLSNENTTPFFKQETLGTMPAFAGTFTTSPKESSHALSVDELNYSASKMQYRWKFAGPASNTRSTFWFETFTPNNPNDPALTEIPASQITVVKSYTGTALLTDTYSVNVAERFPNVNGKIVIDPIALDIVRKNDSDEYQPVDDIPVMVPENGVGRGSATVPFNGTPEFTLESLQGLDSQSIDTLAFATGGQQSTLTETGNDTKIFESPDEAITVEVLSAISFDENTYDTFNVLYSNTDETVSDQLNSMGETEDPGIFRSMRFEMSGAFTQAPSSSQVDTIRFTITNSEVGDTISDTLTETGTNTLVFSDTTSSIVVNLSGTLSSGQVDSVDVEATFPDIRANGIALSLDETSTSSLVFSNFSSGTTTFANETPRTPSENVEIFRVRRYSGQTGDTIQMTVKTSVDEVPITLTRTTGGEFMSEKMIMIRAGEDVSEIPEALLFTVIQVESDAAQESKEIEFVEDSSEQTITTKNALPSAYIAHSFTSDTLKQQGERFVDLWKADVPDKLGWALTGNAADYSSTKAKFLDALPKSGFLGWFGHGLRTKESPAFIGLQLVVPTGGTPGTDNELLDSQLPAGLEYEFVFLNGCGSATVGNPAAESFIAKFNSKAYLGWTAPAGGAPAGIFANKLIKEVDLGKPLAGAISKAWNETPLGLKVVAASMGAPGSPRTVWRADVPEPEKTTFTLDRKK